MEADEVRRFEEGLRNDAQFREEFDYNKELLESMQMHYKSALKDKLRALEDTAPAPFRKKASTWPTYKLAGIAAAVTILMALGYGLFFNQPDPQRTFAQYYSPYYNVLEGTERSGNTTRGSLAMRLYDQQRYEEAARVFDRVVRQLPNNSAFRFYAALSQMSAGQADAAITNLQQVLKNPQDQWHEPARWYLGLAHLQQGDTEKARELLQAIAASESSYRRQAREVLDALE